MKILHTVESYHPSVGGMQEVVRRLSEGLASKGHTVTVATSYREDRLGEFLSGVKIAQFKIGGNAVRGFQGTQEEIQRYQDFVHFGDFDIVVNFAAQQWATDLCLPILRTIDKIKISVPTGFSMLFDKEYTDYFKNMRDWAKEYDFHIVLSEDYRDVNFLLQNGISKMQVIPNAASKLEFEETEFIDVRSKYKIRHNSFLVFNVGSHTGVKGHAEIIKIFKLANIPNSTLVINGNHYKPAGCANECETSARFFNISHLNRKIKVLDIPRKDTVNFYKQSNLFLFASNIECSPIVLFEAMAGGLPFLTGNVGNSKEILKWSKNAGLLLPTKIKDGFSYVDTVESSKMLKDLYSKPDLIKKMGELGHRIWLEKFTWEKITSDYENVYLNLMEQIK